MPASPKRLVGACCSDPADVLFCHGQWRGVPLPVDCEFVGRLFRHVVRRRARGHPHASWAVSVTFVFIYFKRLLHYIYICVCIYICIYVCVLKVVIWLIFYFVVVAWWFIHNHKASVCLFVCFFVCFYFFGIWYNCLDFILLYRIGKLIF